MLSFSNFVRTTLRAPVTPSDTMLLLEAGSGALFGLTSGDYCYLTVNDGVTVEVMKYTSIGPVVNDTLPVARGQDGTTAKAFPAGACVQVAWNKAQVADFVTQLYNEMFDAALLGADTIQVTATPTSPPPGGVFYAVNVATHQLWYWNVNGPAWIELGNISQGIVVTTAPPSGAPAANVRFAVNTSDATLWYWNNTAWIQISSAAASGGAEVWTRQNVNEVTAPVGGPPIVGASFNWTDHAHWQANTALASSLQWAPEHRFKANHDMLVVVSIGVNAEAATHGVDCKGTVVLTTDDPGLPTGEWGVGWNFDPGQTSPAVVASITTTPLVLHAGKVVDLNIIVDGASASGLLVHKILISMEILALM